MNAIAFIQTEGTGTGGQPTVPRMIAFNGILVAHNGQPLSGVIGVTLALYSEQRGGAPLWVESQNVQADPSGRFSLLLGAASGDGLPMDLFTSGQPRWLGIQPQLPGEEEQPRVLLVSVPYALKAADADTINGKPASAFVLASAEMKESGQENMSVDSDETISAATATETISGTAGQIPKFSANGSDLENSVMTENGGNIGIGTTVPFDLLTVGAGGTGSNDAALRIDSGSGGGRPLLRFTRNNIANVLMGVASGNNSLTPGSAAGDFVFRGQDQKILFTSTAGASTSLAVDTGGNVGVGTAAPSDLLTVGAGGTGANDAAVRIDSGSGGGRPLLRFARNGSAYALMGLASGPDSLTPGSAAGDFVFRGQSQKILFTPDGGTTALAIAADGNVGVGTANPAGKLDVAGTVNATGLNVTGVAAINPVPEAPEVAALVAVTQTSTTQNRYAIAAQTASSGDESGAIIGYASASTGSAFGVGGFTNSSDGGGVVGGAGGESGGVGVFGFSDKADGIAGVFQNYDNTGDGPGKILSALIGDDTEVFTVRGAGGNFGSGGKVGIGISDNLARLTIKGAAPFGSGTVSFNNGSSTLTGSGTRFLRELAVGDVIRLASTNQTFTVTAVTSDTSATVSSNTGASTAGSAFSITQAYFRVDDAGGTARMVIQNPGNVVPRLGIGTINPGDPLDVRGTIFTNNRLTIGSNNQRRSLFTVKGVTFSAIAGTVAVTSDSTAVVGTGTLFLTNVGLGDRIQLGGSSTEIRTVTAITDNTNLTVDTPFTVTAAGATLTPMPALIRADDVSANSRFIVSDQGSVGIGTVTPTRELEVNGGVRLNTVNAKPTCGSNTRGTFWFTQQGADVEDSVEVCVKNAANTYVWKSVF